MALGFSWLEPERANVESEVFFSGSFGGGYKLPLSERLYLRLEGRGHAVFVGSGGGLERIVRIGGVEVDEERVGAVALEPGQQPIDVGARTLDAVLRGEGSGMEVDSCSSSNPWCRLENLPVKSTEESESVA